MVVTEKKRTVSSSLKGLAKKASVQRNSAVKQPKSLVKKKLPTPESSAEKKTVISDEPITEKVFCSSPKGCCDTKFISNQERLQEQVEKYSSLAYRKTFRGVAFYITFFVGAITLLAALLTENFDVLYGLSFIVPMLYLIRKSYAWVYVMAILWWSIEKGVQLWENNYTSASVSVILWWFIVCYVYYRAFQVEWLRTKTDKELGQQKSKQFYIKEIAISVLLFLCITFCIAFFSV